MCDVGEKKCRFPEKLIDKWWMFMMGFPSDRWAIQAAPNPGIAVHSLVTVGPRTVPLRKLEPWRWELGQPWEPRQPKRNAPVDIADQIFGSSFLMTSFEDHIYMYIYIYIYTKPAWFCSCGCRRSKVQTTFPTWPDNIPVYPCMSHFGRLKDLTSLYSFCI